MQSGREVWKSGCVGCVDGGFNGASECVCEFVCECVRLLVSRRDESVCLLSSGASGSRGKWLHGRIPQRTWAKNGSSRPANLQGQRINGLMAWRLEECGRWQGRATGGLLPILSEWRARREGATH